MSRALVTGARGSMRTDVVCSAFWAVLLITWGGAYLSADESAIPEYGPEVQARLDALKAKGEPVTLEDLTPDPIPPEEDASPIYRQALAAYVEPDETVSRLRRRDQWSADEAEKVRQWVESNDEALALLRRASLLEGCQLDEPYKQVDGTLPQLPAGLTPVLLLRCSMLLRARNDQAREALDDCLTLLRMTRHFGLRGTPADFWGLGYGVTNALRPLPKLLPRVGLGDSDCKELTKVLKDLLRSMSLVRMFQLWRADMIDKLVPIGAFSESEVLAMLDMWDRLISVAEKPHYERGDELDRLEYSDESFTSMPWFMSASADFVPMHVSLQAVLLQTLIAVELEAHRQAVGDYPTHLTDIKLAYLEELPSDPCSGQPFHYEKRDDGYLLYSLGANGKDDGGKSDRDQGFDDIPWTVDLGSGGEAQ